MTDAALGFFRSGSVHKDSDLFTNLKDYLSVEKVWFKTENFQNAPLMLSIRGGSAHISSLRAEGLLSQGP